MAIENRNLDAGTRLVARFKKQDYTCEVLKGEGDKLVYRLEDGRDFKSPSAAGNAITGQACNGWVFWSIEGEAKEPKERKPRTTTPKATKKVEPELEEEEETTAEEEGITVEKVNPPTKDTGTCKILRVANQVGSPEGQTRWRCYTCKQSFFVKTGVIPTSH